MVDNPWIVLPGEPGLLRGSLHLDRTGVFGGDLIVVTTTGGVWRVKSTAATDPTDPNAVKKLAQIPTHLEGLNTIPDDPARYGPWAGKILIGAEEQSRLYAVDPQGAVTFYEIGIAPEDIEVIRPTRTSSAPTSAEATSGASAPRASRAWSAIS